MSRYNVLRFGAPQGAADELDCSCGDTATDELAAALSNALSRIAQLEALEADRNKAAEWGPK